MLQNEYLRPHTRLDEVSLDDAFYNTKSAKMRELLDRARCVAGSRSDILIAGESGVGKSILAKAIHNDSLTSRGPFVEVDIGAIPANLIISQLFGSVKGAFTDATTREGFVHQANGGTLFLDDIDCLPLDDQKTLLHLLDTGRFVQIGSSRVEQVEFRLIAASNAPLDALVEQGKFRRDLYYRISSVVLDVPPLRERKEDLPSLIRREFAQVFQRENKGKEITQAVMAKLLSYDWPGNLREISNVVNQAVVCCQGDVIGIRDLRIQNSKPAPAAIVAAPVKLQGDLEDALARQFRGLTFNEAIKALEKIIIQDALTRHNGNLTAVAKELHKTRPALRDRIEALGIERWPDRVLREEGSPLNVRDKPAELPQFDDLTRRMAALTGKSPDIA